MAALEALLSANWHPADARPILRERLSEIGAQTFLDEEYDHSIDVIELTQLWRMAAEYAGQGIAPWERHSEAASIPAREARVRRLLVTVEQLRASAAALVGDKFDYILEACSARGALDFGGTLTLQGLQIISGLSMAGVRNAVSARAFQVDDAGCVTAEEANAWLKRRREFCPSRWPNPQDDQYAWEDAAISEALAKGMILVPQSSDNELFVPALVARFGRGPSGVSFTIGAKGEEVHYHDFYEALAALAKLDVARWRRRNSAGNWGIVRARGAWVQVSKAEIDRQIAEKTGAVS
jgi:hypothetical protein